jgi:hypothetical protein
MVHRFCSGTSTLQRTPRRSCAKLGVRHNVLRSESVRGLDALTRRARQEVIRAPATAVDTQRMTAYRAVAAFASPVVGNLLVRTGRTGTAPCQLMLLVVAIDSRCAAFRTNCGAAAVDRIIFLCCAARHIYDATAQGCEDRGESEDRGEDRGEDRERRPR